MNSVLYTDQMGRKRIYLIDANADLSVNGSEIIRACRATGEEAAVCSTGSCDEAKDLFDAIVLELMPATLDGKPAESEFVEGCDQSPS